MKKIDVKVMTLEPMQVASANVVDESPEMAAWEKLKNWAEPKGYLVSVRKSRLLSLRGAFWATKQSPLFNDGIAGRRLNSQGDKIFEVNEFVKDVKFR